MTDYHVTPPALDFRGPAVTPEQTAAIVARLREASAAAVEAFRPMAEVVRQAGLGIAEAMAASGMSAVALELAARRDRVAQMAVDPHRWHTHFTFHRPDSAHRSRVQVRLLRLVGASHGEMKHARDLMRQAEKAEARAYRGRIRTHRSGS